MRWLFKLLFILISIPVFAQSVVKPLPNAHAHNDYEHTRPLYDALSYGFASVEADIFLIDDELYVYHDRPETPSPNRTLKKLYLDPMFQRVMANGGKVYPNYDVSFFLMLDIKKEGEAVYQKLKEILPAYDTMLTKYNGLEVEQGPVTIFLSGDRPIRTLMKEQNRLMALDGRPTDIGRGIHRAYMPVISGPYGLYLKWKGEGSIPPKDWRTLRLMVANAHGEGKKVRFWASPDHPAVWKMLIRAQVDLINTDDLEGLRDFLIKK